MTAPQWEKIEELSAYCKQLKLSQRIVEHCKTRDSRDLEFLLELFASEISARKSKRISMRLNLAGFPMLKTFDTYDFSGVTFPPSLRKEELLELNFVEEKQNLILYGPVGTGKTHMAVALGVMACQMDMNVRFYTVAGLVTKLGEHYRNGKLERLSKELSKLDLLILDEWGYVPVDRQGSQLLFRIIGDSYERNSLVVTTNLEFSKWGSIFTDEQMAAAMIDRLVHHGHLLAFEGQSYRLTHALMRKGMTKMMEGQDVVN